MNALSTGVMRAETREGFSFRGAEACEDAATTGVRALTVGGLTRRSERDWPGRVVATVFCQGCGWRCRYCHRPELRSFLAPAATRGELGWTWPTVLAWLRDRRGALDGVVFSGGEPTVQPALPGAVLAARELGFRVGLHTGGPAPEMLAEVLPLLDWVGFDFKAPFRDYARVTARPGGDAARLSLAMIRAAGVDYEVRTTWHPALLDEAALGEMADTLAAQRVEEWVLQPFRAEGCTDAGLAAAEPAAGPEADRLARAGLRVRVRG